LQYRRLLLLVLLLLLLLLLLLRLLLLLLTAIAVNETPAMARLGFSQRPRDRPRCAWFPLLRHRRSRGDGTPEECEHHVL
jgi:hypothetical protein